MCGLFMQTTCYSNGFSQQHYEQLIANAFINGWRGIDSTGMVVVTFKDKAESLKQLGTIFDLIGSSNYGEFKSKIMSKGKLVFGHGRQATRGTINLKNAHPFYIGQEDGLFFVHNGTLDQNQKLPDLHKFEVDSEWLGTKIWELGPEEALANIAGPIAAIWYNMKEKQTYFYRNMERPLHVARLKDKTLIVNSDENAIKWLNLKYNLSLKDEDIHFFEPDTLYSLPSDTLEDFKRVKIVRKFYAAPVFPKSYMGEALTGGVTEDLTAVRRIIPFRQRSTEIFTDDIKKIFEGKILSVEYDRTSGKKITTMADGSTTVISMYPGEPNLVKLELAEKDKQRLCKTYHENVGKNTQAIHRKYVELAEYMDQAPPPPITIVPEKLAVDVRISSNAILKFSAHVGKRQINNRILCEDFDPRYLKIYNNNIDGTFQCGDWMQIEAFDFARLPSEKTHVYKVTGALLAIDGGQNSIIDVSFYDFDKPIEEMKAVQFYAGKINWMSLATVKEEAANGAKILMQLKDVKPAKDMTNEERNLMAIQRAMKFKEALHNQWRLKDRRVYNAATYDEE